MKALEAAYDDDLLHTAHRPYPLPKGKWRLRQRWLDLLFAHWPIAREQLAPLLPPGLEPDLFDGSAWLGVVPFRMDQVRSRIVGAQTVSAPTTKRFLELNLRTYVRSTRTGKAGVYFYALDCSSLLSVLGARVLFHLPYFPAAMKLAQSKSTVAYTSRRRFSRRPVLFEGSYGPVSPIMAPSSPGTLEHFLTERYSLFTRSRGRLLVGEIHHLPWPLQPADAEIERNDLPQAHGFTLPHAPPVLHFAKELRVSLWGLRPEGEKA